MPPPAEVGGIRGGRSGSGMSADRCGVCVCRRQQEFCLSFLLIVLMIKEVLRNEVERKLDVAIAKSFILYYMTERSVAG